MTRSSRLLAALAGGLLLLPGAHLAGCKSHDEGSAPAAQASAAAFGGAECGACGMVVREQPAPRGQLVYHDGTRVFFCSLGDLVQYMQSPSPHGSVEQVYVEVLDPKADPHQPSTAPRPWEDADRAAFVLGVKRGHVMGEPVLAYASKSAAEAVAKRYGGRLVTWSAVRKELAQGGPAMPMH